MDLQTHTFQVLVIQLLKMILYVLVYPDMRGWGRTKFDVEALMHLAREFVRINTKESGEGSGECSIDDSSLS